MNEVLLSGMLQVAVPLRCAELSGYTWSHVEHRARICSQVVAEKGDVIQFKSKSRGETAFAFNALAEGLACLAFAPGGVKFAGVHWEEFHPGVYYAGDLTIPGMALLGLSCAIPGL